MLIQSSRYAGPNGNAKLSDSRETSRRLEASEVTYAWVLQLPSIAKADLAWPHCKSK
jgi:hypothetical protein